VISLLHWQTPISSRNSLLMRLLRNQPALPLLNKSSRQFSCDLGQKIAVNQTSAMTTKSLLLAVTDPTTLVDINQTLGAGWEAISAPTEAEAMAQLEKRSFDALLVDFQLGEPDASELLNLALEKRPETIRFLLAYEADLALVAAKVLGSHQILPKPLELKSLKARIENAVNDSNSNQNGDQSAAEVGPAPTLPPVYSQVLSALDSPGVTNEQLGEIIASDPALTTELLALTRSAYMGLRRNITDPAEAVQSLGLAAVRALVTARRFLAEHSHLKLGYLSLEQTWRHCTNVALIARDLVLFETKDRALASQALAAGLLHDLGKVVLATNFDDTYGRVHSLARKQPVPLCDIEKEMFGANHGEIGACLVGMWNMPSSVVEAVACHHEPPLGEHDHLTSTGAVHIANVLEHQLRPTDESRVAPIISAAYLNELGLLERLPVWRATFAYRGHSNQQSHGSVETDELGSETRAGESTVLLQTANRILEPTAESQTTTSGRRKKGSRQTVSAARFWRRGWAYAGFAAGLLCLFALWVRTQPDAEESMPVYARTPAAASSQPPELVPSSGLPETPSTPVPEVLPATSVSEATPTAAAASTPDPAMPEVSPARSVSEAAPTASAVSTPKPAISEPPPTPSLPPKESAPPDFRLSGILYTVANPSAILNGKTVYVGDKVSGATVLSIGRTEVTLQINGLRKTFALH
jgi:putative nucleotidyltransferase with HDIG domain